MKNCKKTTANTNITCCCSTEADNASKLKDWIRLQTLAYNKHDKYNIEINIYFHLSLSIANVNVLLDITLITHAERLSSRWQFHRCLLFAGDTLHVHSC